MSLTITLTGTGSAQLVPVFGCDCAACRRARLQDNYRRRPCSAVVKFNDAVTLLDAGIPHLMDDWPAGSFQQFYSRTIIWITSGAIPSALGRGRNHPGVRPAGRRRL